MQVKYGALGIGLALCLTIGVSLGNSAVQWQPSLERAQVVAAHSNRLVLVHFWGNGCPPCAWMDREVFTRPDVAQAIDRGFVAVKVNKDQFPGAANQFGITAVPTDIIMTPQGQILGSYVGRAPAPEYVSRLNQVAQQFGATPPGQAQPWGGASQAVAGASNYPQPGLQALQLEPNPGHAVGGVGPGQSVSPYSQQSYPDQALAAQMSPRYSEQYGGAGPNDSAMAAHPQSASLNAGSNGMAYAPNSYPPNPQMSPAAAMVQQPGISAPMQQASVPRDGNPPLALDGFCAVSLERTMRVDPQPRWIPGDPRWGLRHEGRTYLFAGPEEQQAFFSNPNFFAPVLSGNDAVLQVEQGQQVAGVREFGARWRDRVYLFSSRENYEKFRANPTFYENEILRSQQAVASAPQSSAQHAGAGMNPYYGFR